MIHFYLNSYNTPACKVICAEIVTQELPHRSSANFQVIKLYLNSCKIRLLEFFYSPWRQGQPGGGLRNVTLCGASDTHSEMRVLFVLGIPSAEIVRVGWANMWCGEMRNFFARSNRLQIVRFERPSMWWNVTLCRDRAGRASKHVAKCKFGGTRRSPFARNEGQPSKTGVKL